MRKKNAIILLGVATTLLLIVSICQFLEIDRLRKKNASPKDGHEKLTALSAANKMKNDLTSPPSGSDEKVSLGAKFMLLTPVWVIGSYDKQDKANMMTAAAVSVCSLRPPCVSICISRECYTFNNIQERKAFTANVPSKAYVNETDYFGMVSGRNVDKLAATRLTAVKGDYVDAPYLEEFPLVLECKLIRTIEVGSHMMLIGEIMDLKANRSVLGENELPDMLKVDPLLYTHGLFNYYNLAGRFAKAYSVGNVFKKIEADREKQETIE